MSLWFVTPAHQRYDLTAICLEQRRRVIETLARSGVEAHCVVVANDANTDTARELGFHTVRQNNHWLGRRFNDGIEYAGKHGAEWIVPIGSDSWVDPAYFLPLPSSKVVRTASEYCPVEADRLAEIVVGSKSGAGPFMFHRRLLEPLGFRPAEDEISRGVDGSTIRGIQAVTGQPIPWQRRRLHPFQYVGFRFPPFITPYQKLWDRWGVREHRDPWTVLARHYPADLVARARVAFALVEAA